MGRGSAYWDSFDAAAVKGDSQAFSSLFADDAVYILPGERHTGRETIRAWVEEWLQAVSDVRTEASLVVEDGDRVFAEYTWYGTHSGPLPMPDGTAVPPSGKTIELSAVTILTVKDGKVVEARDYYDQLSMLTQLGLMPTG